MGQFSMEISCATGSVLTGNQHSAQQVEAAIGAVGLTSQEFAGLIIDEETGIYGLRDAQFTPILWRALQAALTRIEALEAKCGVLTNSG